MQESESVGDGPGAADLASVAAKWRARIEPIARGMTSGLIERDREARLVLLAMLSAEHALLVGPPGTAKSLLARRLREVVSDARYFERLLTRFTVPEELFGPLSLRGLESDEYRRLTRGYLPEAHVAFLDEVFKAGSPILNTLLSLLEERTFDNGAGAIVTPLLSIVGASNELPAGDELSAFADRFLVRLSVSLVTDTAFPALLDPEPRPSLSIDPIRRSEIDEIRATSASVGIPVAIVRMLVRVRSELIARGVAVSDRRWRKVAKLLRTAALVDGRTRVSLDDMTLLECCVGLPQNDEVTVRQAIEAALVDFIEQEPSRIEVVVAERERRAAALVGQSQAVDSEGRLLYVSEDGSITTEPFREIPRRSHSGDHLYLPPPDVALAATDKRTGYSLEELWTAFFQSRPNGLARLEAYAANPLYKVMEKVPRAKSMREVSASPEERALERARVVELVEELRSMHADLDELRSRQRTSSMHAPLFRWRDLGYQSDEQLVASQALLASLLARLAAIEAVGTEAP